MTYLRGLHRPWGKQGFGGRAGDTLAWLEQAVPGISQRVFYKGRLQGCFEAATRWQGCLHCGRQHKRTRCMARRRPSVWFPGWLEYEAAHLFRPGAFISALAIARAHQNQTMASVGDNIRALHTALTRRGKRLQTGMEHRRPLQRCRPTDGKSICLGYGRKTIK